MHVLFNLNYWHYDNIMLRELFHVDLLFIVGFHHAFRSISLLYCLPGLLWKSLFLTTIFYKQLHVRIVVNVCMCYLMVSI